MPQRKLVENTIDRPSPWFINRWSIERAKRPNPDIVAKLPPRAPYSHHNGFRPLMLDVCCGAGGTSVGYWLAGFNVIGVDKYLQPSYPFPFFHMDALAILRARKFMIQFQFVHASPPCPIYSRAQALNMSGVEPEPDLIMPIRKALNDLGIPYVIENVEGAPLHSPIVLCGSMFGLQVQRHRLFESSETLKQPQCNHDIWVRSYPPQIGIRSGKPARTVGVYGRGAATNGEFNGTDLWKWAMGMPWPVNRKEVADAIPPVYTEYIGWQLMDILSNKEKGE